MLKIKDNVDLKELEKFGFVEYHGKYFHRDDESYENVVVQENRYISFESEEVSICGAFIEDKLSILFDLIQAGLVEKVV